jgi:hypothetical protein
VVAAVVAAFVLSARPETRPSQASDSPATATPAGGTLATPIALDDVPVQPPTGGFPVGDPGPGGDQDGGAGDQGGAGGEDPAEGQDIDQPVDPCADAGAKLAVSPDPLALPAGATSGAVTLHNCGTEPTGWTSATKPWVALGAKDGTLAAGATAELGFTVDDSALPAGAYTFRIKVSQPGHNVPTSTAPRVPRSPASPATATSPPAARPSASPRPG